MQALCLSELLLEMKHLKLEPSQLLGIQDLGAERATTEHPHRALSYGRLL